MRARARVRARQGASAGGLMAWFDSVRKEQEGMAAEAFNHDETFKSRLNEVPRRRGGPARARATMSVGPPPWGVDP